MSLPFFLALRFLRGSHQEKTISVMVKICFFSMLIGSCALTLVAAIMNGFEAATCAKLQGVHADIVINAHDKAIDYEKLKKVLATEYADTIYAICPTHMSQVILQTAHSQTAICLLKAIDPEPERLVSTLPSMITRSSIEQSSSAQPWDLLNTNVIFIGESLAKHLHCGVGDSVTILYPEESHHARTVHLEEKVVKIGALFKTGIHDFDEQIIVGSLSFARSLYPAAISQVSVMLKDRRQEQTVIESLKKRLSLEVCSWKDLYPSLVSALILEKYAMFFVLVLVALVASLNMMSLLFMYVAQKRTEIAILKTMGMSDGGLISIFLLLSASVTLCATTCGILLASIVTYLLNRFPFIQLPDVYYVSHLPAKLDVRILCLVMLLALVVSIISALLPARKIKAMLVTQILKSVA